ncbi:DUF29 domain-containing protein [Rhodopila sp.]|uniref:DUF29 domain-containing protein n=1 Tax=Rhodopila sp. TaxID=2480087 RepID=UPI003D12DF73
MNDLYDTDVVAWSEQQAKLLSRMAAGERVNSVELDWPNIAEEIESLGKSYRRELRSHIGTVLEHLIKLQASPALDPRNGWKETIGRSRDDIDLILAESPSLRHAVPTMIADETTRSRRRVARSLGIYNEQPRVDIDGLTFTEDQVVGDWLP